MSRNLRLIVGLLRACLFQHPALSIPWHSKRTNPPVWIFRASEGQVYRGISPDSSEDTDFTARVVVVLNRQVSDNANGCDAKRRSSLSHKCEYDA